MLKNKIYLRYSWFHKHLFKKVTDVRHSMTQVLISVYTKGIVIESSGTLERKQLNWILRTE